MPKKKNILINAGLIFISVIFLFLCLELCARAYYQLQGKVPFFALTTSGAQDALLGWKGQETWGDTRSGKIKVFFVGDSFTYRDKDLKGRMYYDVVGQNIDIEPFVYGGGGYSTLQEYLAIDKYIDEIKPDLVVLQVCSNDFINNSWELERRSYMHNNYTVRPYYEGGKIKYRFPRGPVFLRQYLIPYSRLAYFFAVKIDRKLADLAGKGRLKTIENYIETGDTELKEFKRSADTTEELIGVIRKRCGKTPIIAFSTFDDEPYSGRFKLIFRRLDIDFLTDIPKLAWDAERRGKVRNNDHWSEKGHAACGTYLAEYIRTNFLKDRQ